MNNVGRVLHGVEKAGIYCEIAQLNLHQELMKQPVGPSCQVKNRSVCAGSAINSWKQEIH